ncbi:MAG: hydrogenase maturation protein HypF [Clostridia bacterium]|nr:hydrogenase maturation protein HypF [Clostridia bacterium]
MAKGAGAPKEGRQERVCYRLTVQGIVQGIGFRPFVYRLAQKMALGGTVYNSSNGTVIEVEGNKERVTAFLREILERPPRLARISGWTVEEIAPTGKTTFYISTSKNSREQTVTLPPDLAVCPECRREVEDPADRHYAYPFTNCTNCGPRFTIIYELPYDRMQTAMRHFNMCPECAAEYENPGDRRFHAQPVACPRCGPRIQLVDNSGRPVEGDPVKAAAQLLRQGAIVAVKGLGGFHLAADATDEQAVLKLRARKSRLAKPFAVMARDLEVVAKYCYLSPQEAELLNSTAAPIVLLRRRQGTGLAPQVAPGLSTLGVMLPYTPLHLLLLKAGPELLVMTSANPSDLPLVKDNEVALVHLRSLADYFLWHDRPIVNRCDDSVVAVRLGEPHFYRRSRGYVPQPLEVPVPDGPVMLATGGDLKNVFCLLKGNQAYLSQHIGDLGNLETQAAFRESLERFKKLLGVEPGAVVCDLHPGYYSRRLAGELGLRVVEVQHHHAHMASCLAENGVSGEVIGVIFDGTGFGLDGAIWGGEFFTGSLQSFSRQLHFRYFPLPGGDRGVRWPWYMAVSLLNSLGPEGENFARKLFSSQGKNLEIVLEMLRRRFHTIPTSSVGRLFDAVAALTGICLENKYDGQAAVELEEAALAHGGLSGLDPYPFLLREGEIDPLPVIQAICRDLSRGARVEEIAARFHSTIIRAVAEGVKLIAGKTGISKVALSGGVWHNTILLEGTYRELAGHGFKVYIHRQVPTNDGGLSLGQAAVARYKLRQEEG